MSGVLPLKSAIIYGPVPSRRLGRSLGINLLPPRRKWCTFDCVYCQYGWTGAGSVDIGPADFPSVRDVETAVRAALGELSDPPAYLTFSGNGEPTLHPDFPRLVKAVRSLRDELARGAKTALLSNSSRAARPEIRGALEALDRAILKFDAGNERAFLRFNRPSQGVRFEEILSGLRDLGGVTLQALFATGPQGNLNKPDLDDWLEQVRTIRPRDVQVYTISRPVPSREIAPAAAWELAGIRDRLLRAGIPAEAF